MFAWIKLHTHHIAIPNLCWRKLTCIGLSIICPLQKKKDNKEIFNAKYIG